MMRRPDLAARRPADAVSGFVSLVGAGPGSPDLLTARAIARLGAADVVFYDGLVPAAILDCAPGAAHVSVARRSGAKTLTQDAVNDLLIAHAARGERVVRLKSGDPFVLGRGGEEALALAAAGVPFEVVPGVSSAFAAPALAGIPVTHRGVASAVLVVSGHAEASYGPVLGALPAESVTIVVLMGMAARRRIQACLAGAGWPAATPAAIVANASQPSQRVWLGSLETLHAGDIVDAGLARGDDDPGVIVIGRVVSLGTTPDLVRSFAPEETAWQPLTIPRR